MQQKIRFFSIALLLFLLISQVVAQDDLTFTGEIENEREEDEFIVELAEGDSIIITAIAPDDSELDTVLTLENEDGDEVAFNDDYEFPTTTNSQIAYTADESGDYTLIISSYPGTDGEYEITVEFVTAEEVAVINGEVEIELGEPDLEFDGFVSDDTEGDEYSIELEEGDAIVINAEADDSDLDTVLTLLNEDGDEVAYNDDRVPGEDFNSQIVYIVEEDGEYTIVISNYPSSEGDYILTVHFVSAETAQQLISANEEASRPEIDTTPERDPDESYTGTIDDDEEPIEYTVELEAGDGIIAALYATDDNLDALLYVLDPNGVEIARNDDRGDYSTLDSQVAFTAEIAGEYTIVASNYPEYPGDYRLDIYFADADEVSLAAQAMRVLLSGVVEIYDTEHFRIHYTQEGVDAAEFDYVELVGETMEEVIQIQIDELGWVLPPTDATQGGDSRYDVYLINLDDFYGYASSSSAEGDNPHTDITEEFAQAGYLVLDNDYSDEPDSVRALRATAAHEFHHVIQFGYDNADWNWYYEATASWMETVTFPDDELATIYIDNIYTYPEACFGGDGDADLSGGGIYGTWLFFEFMSRTLGDEAPFTLWDHIAIEDGWAPLEQTLIAYDETLPDFLAQYHINNLVRDYEFVDSFEGSTVWLEETINDIGNWSVTGEGIQELGANYFALEMPRSVYSISIDDDELQIFVIGIDGDLADVYSLGDEGTVNTHAYDDVYVMVFNPSYDDDILECSYFEYEISLEKSSSTPNEVIDTVDASHFLPLGN